MSRSTLLLTRSDVAKLLTLKECIGAIEQAFRLHGEGKAPPPGVLGVHVEGGGFHIKAGTMSLSRNYFAAKCNANFPGNPSRYGLPTIQGTIALCDVENGYPLALMDSIEITIQRTAAASAVAAKYLARAESKTITICGCGNQGRAQLRALLEILPLRRVFAWDVDDERANAYAREVTQELRLEASVAADLKQAIRDSDVCVTCTPAKRYFVEKEFVAPGAFVAAVGADNPEKQELEPALLAEAKVVADIREQACSIGDTHHAIAAGIMRAEDIYGELGEIIAGKKPGRTSADQIFIFDSTGMALQDVAAAALVYEMALQQRAGTHIDFFA